MSLRTHLTIILSIIILTIIAGELTKELPCPDSLARYCLLGQTLTKAFLIIFSGGLIITLTAYFFIGYSRSWSYLKTYLLAIATYLLTTPIYYFLFTRILPIVAQTQVVIK